MDSPHYNRYRFAYDFNSNRLFCYRLTLIQNAKSEEIVILERTALSDPSKTWAQVDPSETLLLYPIAPGLPSLFLALIKEESEKSYEWLTIATYLQDNRLQLKKRMISHFRCMQGEILSQMKTLSSDQAVTIERAVLKESEAMFLNDQTQERESVIAFVNADINSLLSQKTSVPIASVSFESALDHIWEIFYYHPEKMPDRKTPPFCVDLYKNHTNSLYMKSNGVDYENTLSFDDFFNDFEENIRVQKQTEWSLWIESQSPGPLTDIPLVWKRKLILYAMRLTSQKFIAIEGVVSRQWPLQEAFPLDIQLLILRKIAKNCLLKEDECDNITLRKELNEVIGDYLDLYKSVRIVQLFKPIFRHGFIRNGIEILNLFLIGAQKALGCSLENLHSFNLDELDNLSFEDFPEHKLESVLSEADHVTYSLIVRVYTDPAGIALILSLPPEGLLRECSQIHNMMKCPAQYSDLVSLVNLSLSAMTHNRDGFDERKYLQYLLQERSKKLDEDLSYLFDEAMSHPSPHPDYMLELFYRSPCLADSKQLDFIHRNKHLIPSAQKNLSRWSALLRGSFSSKNFATIAFLITNYGASFSAHDWIVCLENADNLLMRKIIDLTDHIRLNDAELVTILGHAIKKAPVKNLYAFYSNMINKVIRTQSHLGLMYIIHLKIMGQLKKENTLIIDASYSFEIEALIDAISIILNNPQCSQNDLIFFQKTVLNAPANHILFDLELFSQTIEDLFSMDTDYPSFDIASIVQPFFKAYLDHGSFHNMFAKLSISARISLIKHCYCNTLTQDFIRLLKDHSAVILLHELLKDRDVIVFVLKNVLSNNIDSTIRPDWGSTESYFSVMSELIIGISACTIEEIKAVWKDNPELGILLALAQYKKNPKRLELQSFLSSLIFELFDIFDAHYFGSSRNTEGSYSYTVESMLLTYLSNTLPTIQNDYITQILITDIRKTVKLFETVAPLERKENDKEYETFQEYCSLILEQYLRIPSKKECLDMFGNTLWQKIIYRVLDRLFKQKLTSPIGFRDKDILCYLIDNLNITFCPLSHRKGAFLKKIYEYSAREKKAQIESYALAHYETVIQCFSDLVCPLPGTLSSIERSVLMQHLITKETTFFHKYLKEGCFKNEEFVNVIQVLANLDNNTIETIFTNSSELGEYLLKNLEKELSEDAQKDFIKKYPVLIVFILKNVGYNLSLYVSAERKKWLRLYFEIHENLSDIEKEELYFYPFVELTGQTLVLKENKIDEFICLFGHGDSEEHNILKELASKYHHQMIESNRNQSCFLSKTAKAFVFPCSYDSIDQSLFHYATPYKKSYQDIHGVLEVESVKYLKALYDLSLSITNERLEALWKSGLLLPRTALLIGAALHRADIMLEALEYETAKRCDFIVFYMAMRGHSHTQDLLNLLERYRPKDDQLLEYIFLIMMTDIPEEFILRVLNNLHELLPKPLLEERLNVRVVLNPIYYYQNKGPSTYVAKHFVKKMNMLELALFFDQADLAIFLLNQQLTREHLFSFYENALSYGSLSCLEYVMREHRVAFDQVFLQKGLNFLFMSEKMLAHLNITKEHALFLEKVEKMLCLLIENGAHINATIEDSPALLFHLIAFGSKELIKIALRCGADPTIELHEGMTAIALAESKNIPLKELIEECAKELKKSEPLIFSEPHKHNARSLKNAQTNTANRNDRANVPK